MKALLRFTLMALATVWFAAAARAAAPTYRIEVAGLACPFCAYGIEKRLNAIEGVERLETNIKEGTVIITMRDRATLDKAAVDEAVREAGFTLNRFEKVTAGDGD